MPSYRTGESVALSGSISNNAVSNLTFSRPVSYIRITNNSSTVMYVRFNTAITLSGTNVSIFDVRMLANSTFELEDLIITSVSIYRSGALIIPNSAVSIVGW